MLQELPVNDTFVRASEHVSIPLALEPLVDFVELADLIQNRNGLWQGEVSRVGVDDVLGEVRRNSPELWDLLLVVLGRPVECVSFGVCEYQNNLAVFFSRVRNVSREVILPFEPLSPSVSLNSHTRHY